MSGREYDEQVGPVRVTRENDDCYTVTVGRVLGGPGLDGDEGMAVAVTVQLTGYEMYRLRRVIGRAVGTSLAVRSGVVRACPRCASEVIESTTMGLIPNVGDSSIDPNRHSCQGCGYQWRQVGQAGGRS